MLATSILILAPDLYGAFRFEWWYALFYLVSFGLAIALVWLALNLTSIWQMTVAHRHL